MGLGGPRNAVLPAGVEPRASTKLLEILVNVKQVIVIRKDLGMRRGKEIAQGAHASIAFMANQLVPVPNEHGVDLGIRSLLLSAIEVAWLDSGFRKICCVVNSEKELLDLVQEATFAGVYVELIKDAGATEFGGVPTYTAAAFGPDTDENLDPITGGLTLY